MKHFTLVLAFAGTLFFGFSPQAEAQSVNVSINIGNQPAWGPVGYDYAGYYYFPDIEVYYDVNRTLFYYPYRGTWVSSRYLPHSYAHYNLYNMYKVVINDPSPWRYHSRHRTGYAHYRGNRNQVVIVNSRDHRYHNVRNNKVAWASSDRSYGRSSGSSSYRPGRTSDNYARYSSPRGLSARQSSSGRVSSVSNRSSVSSADRIQSSAAPGRTSAR